MVRDNNNIVKDFSKKILKNEETLWTSIVAFFLVIEIIGHIFPVFFEPILRVMEERMPIFLFLTLFMVLRVIIIKTDEIEKNVKPDILRTNNLDENAEKAKEMMNSSRRSILTTFFSSGVPKSINGKFNDFIQTPVENGIDCKRIISVEDQKQLEYARWLEKVQERHENFQVKLLKTDVNLPSIRVLIDFIVKDKDSVFMTFLREIDSSDGDVTLKKSTGEGTLIKDNKVVEWFQNYFFHLWNNPELTDELDSKKLKKLEQKIS